jgi:hypothetical protein
MTMSTPFRSSNSNIGKQDKLVHKAAGINSESNGQNSASGDMASVKALAGGAVEGGNRPAGRVSQSGRIVNGGRADTLRKRGSDSKNRPAGF